MHASLNKLSTFLSFVLRHNSASIGLSLDPSGWAQVDELLQAAKKSGKPLMRELLQQVVDQNDKQRFSFSKDGQKIRANQGHSIQIDLGLEPLTPPEILFHGTATRFLPSIAQQGLLLGGRLQVHLSPDEQTAMKVGLLPLLWGGPGWGRAVCGPGVWAERETCVNFLLFFY